MSESCLHCGTILYQKECYTCLLERKNEMTMLYDMIDDKTFPMTYERKSLILSIVDFELCEIKEKLEFIHTFMDGESE